MTRALIIFCLFFVSWPALAITWGKAEVEDPLSPEAVCEVHEPASYGGYIYQYPSKYDQVFWPKTDKNGIWYCEQSGFIAFIGDFNDISDEEKVMIANYLSEVKGTDEKPSIRTKLSLLEGVYSIRKTDKYFDNQLLRVLARWHQDLGDLDIANEYRKRAYIDIQSSLDNEITERQRLEYLYLAANYAMQFGDKTASEKYIAELLNTAKNVEDPELQGFTDYFVDLSQDTPNIAPGGILDPAQRMELETLSAFENFKSKKAALTTSYAEGVNQTIRVLINIILGFIIAYLICTKWHGKLVAIAAFIVAILVAWLVGGLLFLQLFVTERFSEAALVVLTRGIWDAILGAGIGVWLGWRSKKRSLASR